MKNGSISKLIITETGHRPTQYKKIVENLPELCVDMNYQGIDDVIWTGTNLVETDLMPTYTDTDQCSTTHHVGIETVNPNDQPEPNTGLRPLIPSPWHNKHTFLKQISRRSYYQNLSRIPKSSFKSTPSSLPTRML